MLKLVDYVKGWLLASLLRRKKRIDFAIIGFPKCGTTSIHKTLVSSPSVSIPDYEVQIKHFIKNHIYSDDNLLFGIKNPNLVYEKHNLQALYNANKNTKIVLGLRNPTDWLYSFFQYRKLEIKNKKGWLSSGKYSQIKRKFKEVGFNEFVDQDLELIGACLKNGIYLDFIRTLLSIFPPSNIHIYILEEMACNPSKVYKQLHDFLGTGYKESWPTKTANRNHKKYESKDKYSKKLQYVTDYYAPYNEKLNLFLKETWGIMNNYW